MSDLPVVNIPEILPRELSNGLSVLVYTDHSAPVVSLQFWCGTGSIHEGQWIGSGISHFLEHLMFKGTPRRGNSEMAQEIQSLGGHLNAYTSFDRTVYYADLPSENWRSALAILGDAVTASTLPPEEFDREQEVIRREFAMGNDNPDWALSLLLFKTAFLRHPYRYPVIGILDLFNQLKREDLLSYYHQRYLPQNLTLVISGPVQSDEVVEEAEKLFGAIPRKVLADVIVPSEPAQIAPRHAVERFPTELSRVTMSFPSAGVEHPDAPVLDVLSILMGGGRSSRLHQRLVERDGVAEEASAFSYTPSGLGVWGVDARTTPDKRDAMLAAIRREVAQIAAEGPANDELERAKRLCLVHQVRSMKTMSGKAAALGGGWLIGRDPLFQYRFLSKLQDVTRDQLCDVAARYLKPQFETCAEIIPSSAPAGILSAKNEKLETPKPALSRLGNIRTLTMNGGNLPLTMIRASFPGGVLQEAPGKNGVARLASQLLLKGTAHRSAEQLACDMESLGAAFGADSGYNSGSLGLELLSRDATQGLDLFLEVLTEARVSENELAIERRKQLAAIQAELDQPMAIARNLLRKELYREHPYARPTLGTAETLEGITVDDISTFWNAFYKSSGLVLSISGADRFDGWQKRCEHAMSGFGATVPMSVSSAIPKLLTSARVEHVSDKEQAVIQIAFPTVSISNPDHLPLALLDEALSDLGSRLFIRIREKMGLAYFVGSTIFPGLDSGYFAFYVGTDPKARQRVEEELLDEIRLTAAGGITSVEMERARAKMLSQDQLQAQDPGAVLAGAALDELYGMGYDFRNQRRERLRRLTLDEVNAVTQKYLEAKPYVTVIVSPQ